ncbi:hypothetical protein AOLI_G00012710 [Acnodon oligacanthus]
MSHLVCVQRDGTGLTGERLSESKHAHRPAEGQFARVVWVRGTDNDLEIAGLDGGTEWSLLSHSMKNRRKSDSQQEILPHHVSVEASFTRRE